MLRRTTCMLAVLGACTALVGSRRHFSPNPLTRKLRDQGNKTFLAGQYPVALKIYQEALKMAATDGDVRLAGRVSTNVGGAYLAMSRYQDAIKYFLEGQRLSEQSQDADGASAAAFNLASLYLQVDDLSAADRAAERGLSASANPFASRSLLLIIRGRIRTRQDRTAEAIQLFHQAIDAAVVKGDARVLAAAWQGLGEGLYRSGDFNRAEEAFERACRIQVASHDPDLRVCYLRLSQTKLKQGDPHGATQLLDKAMSLPLTGLAFNAWRIYQLRGEILQASKRPAEALAWFRKSIEAAHVWSDDLVQNDAVRTSADEWFQQLYGPFIETSISLSGSPHLEAFLAAEENRAASLRHTLTASRSFLTRVPPRYWQIVKQLRSAEVLRLGQETPATKARVDKLRQELVELEARTGIAPIRTISNKTTENNETERALRFIQGGITKGEALLSFYLGSQSSSVWAVTDRGSEFHSLPPGMEISNTARQFNAAVESGSPQRDDLGGKLYTQLFSSLSSEVQAKPDWVISAADELFDIPFAALVTQRNQGVAAYLTEEHSLSRVPSALMLREQKTEPMAGQFLGIADGIYNIADPRYKRPNRHGFPFGFVLSRTPKPSVQLARLVGSDQEIQACSKVWDGSPPAVLLTGRQATRERLESELPSRPEIIHIATHVMAPPGRSEEALINFGLSPEGQPEVLTNSDIATLDVFGSTVVMNGCASAGATAVAGAGVMGLTRAWILAGARTIIGARWPISEDTGVLFESFYSSWRQNRESGPRRSVIARALQQAQIRALRSSTWRSDPKYWSAFYVLGKD